MTRDERLRRIEHRILSGFDMAIGLLMGGWYFSHHHGWDGVKGILVSLAIVTGTSLAWHVWRYNTHDTP